MYSDADTADGSLTGRCDPHVAFGIRRRLQMGQIVGGRLIYCTATAFIHSQGRSSGARTDMTGRIIHLLGDTPFLGRPTIGSASEPSE